MIKGLVKGIFGQMCAMQSKKAYIHNEMYTMEIDIMKSTHNERIHN